MKIDITQMLIVFDEQLPYTDKDQGIYWFKFLRPDSLSIVFVVSVYEGYVGLSVNANDEVTTASLSLKKCSEVHVLDEKLKCLEILHEDNSKGRCFLSLLGKVIMEYKE